MNALLDWLALLAGALSALIGAAVANYFANRSSKFFELKIGAAESDLDAALSGQHFADSGEERARLESAIRPAWEIARRTLEKYWDRNLTQNFFIFVLSVLATVAGFVVMVWGVLVGFYEPHATIPGTIGAAAGVLTQFIGATFLFIYRSTLDQATEFNRTIERINSVGMAWYILQTMPDETEDRISQKNEARLALILRACTPSISSINDK